MRLTPLSRQISISLLASSTPVSPQARKNSLPPPNVPAPKLRTGTFKPEWPSCLYSIWALSTITFYTLLMRSFLLLLICRCLMAQQSSVEGISIDALTGQPLAGVHITMRPVTHAGAASDQAWGAISGKDGHFSITTMPPATYVLTAGHNGYVQVPGKEDGITLKPGEQLTGLNVGLTPEAVISGRVLDDNGDPVPQVQVDAVSAAGSDHFGMEFGRHERTDERGRFRMTGPSGKDYIKASPERQM